MLLKKMLFVSAGLCLISIAVMMGGCEKFQSGRTQLYAACMNSSDDATQDQCNCFTNGLANHYNEDVLKDMAAYMRDLSSVTKVKYDNEEQKTIARLELMKKLQDQLAVKYGAQDAAIICDAIKQNLKSCNVGNGMMDIGIRP